MKTLAWRKKASKKWQQQKSGQQKWQQRFSLS
jgi:hypothetical protein